MNQAHLHLVVNHLPVFGSFFGFLVLAYGVFSKSQHTQITAYFIFVISAIGASVAYYTGEGAEKILEHVIEAKETVIQRHEYFAIYALISFIVLGLLSVIAYIITTYYSLYSKISTLLLLFISLVSLGLSSWTCYLGGQIRHTELNSATPTLIQNGNKEKDD